MQHQNLVFLACYTGTMRTRRQYVLMRNTSRCDQATRDKSWNTTTPIQPVFHLEVALSPLGLGTLDYEQSRP
jgi:hypothetical protein